jgi:hypothetical protein
LYRKRQDGSPLASVFLPTWVRARWGLISSRASLPVTFYRHQAARQAADDRDLSPALVAERPDDLAVGVAGIPVGLDAGGE